MRIMLIGEAWGEAEEQAHAPFMGAAGYELTRMLGEAGISRRDCYLTNVFNLRPQGNDIETLCGPIEEAIAGYPALAPSKYVHSRYAKELTRLGDEILAQNPNIILCLGNTPSWALMGRASISRNRGYTELSTHTVAGYKCLCTYHPAYILRMWSDRPTVIIDFMKAKKESEHADIRRPAREIWIEPDLDDLRRFEREELASCAVLSVDIETSGKLITCIGFAPRPGLALVVPFFDPRRADRSYWPSHDVELQAWRFVKRVLGLPCLKLFQNGLYDIAFLYRSVGIKVRNAEHDTMLLHHALQPESLKSLEFLGSIYTDEGPWKRMGRGRRTIKRED